MADPSQDRSDVVTRVALVLALIVTARAITPAQTSFPWADMARRVVSALRVDRGERIMLRFDPRTMRGLEPEVAAQRRAAGAVVESHPFGPVDGFRDRLERTDVYVWLPADLGTVGRNFSSGDSRDRRPELQFRHLSGS